MNRRVRRIYIVLATIPIAFILFLLALKSILLLLLGIVVTLSLLLVLKRCKPEWFMKEQKELLAKSSTTIPPQFDEALPNATKVYMVLSGREDFGARSISVNKTTYSIGRGKNNDFVIDGKRISRYHLRIEYNLDENASYAIDMDSKNGSYLNNVRMQPGKRYMLSNGDQLMLDDRLFDVSYAHY